MTRRLTTADIDTTREAIRAAGGNIGRAAKALGLTRAAVSKRVACAPEAWPAECERLSPRRPIDPVIRSTEAVHVEAALRASGGNIAKAAHALGMSRARLHWRIAKGVHPWPDDVPRPLPRGVRS